MSAPTVTGEEQVVVIRHTVGGAHVPLNRPKHPSAFQRLGWKWGCKPETAKDRVYGERGIYRMVADANEEFLADGLAERVYTLMACIQASLLTEVPSLTVAINRHNVADASEDVQQAQFVANASSAELRGWKEKLAAERAALDELLASIEHEEQRRAGDRAQQGGDK